MLRVSTKLEWLKKPWGFWQKIESETKNKIKNCAKVTSKWFPEQVEKYKKLTKVNIQID